jgi:hypothetical protein
LTIDPNLSAAQSAAAAAWAAVGVARQQTVATWLGGAASALVAVVAVGITLVEAARARRARELALLEGGRYAVEMLGAFFDRARSVPDPVNETIDYNSWLRVLTGAGATLQAVLSQQTDNVALSRLAYEIRTTMTGVIDVLSREQERKIPFPLSYVLGNLEEDEGRTRTHQSQIKRYYKTLKGQR